LTCPKSSLLLPLNPLSPRPSPLLPLLLYQPLLLYPPLALPVPLLGLLGLQPLRLPR
jgi:hypothetical protein